MLLFTIANGTRTPIQRRGNGSKPEFVVGSEGSARKCRELNCWRKSQPRPEQFSPNVLLRPIVEDYLLPTLAYTGGAAETAYFGQAALFTKRFWDA